MNYTFRMHDPRAGRFFARDPLEKKYPFYSPYQFSGNRVIDMIELEGLEPANTKVNANSQPKGDSWERTDSNGNYTGEAYPITDLPEVVITTTKSLNIAMKALRSFACGINEVFGAMTGASSISPELNAAYNSEYAPATDGKSVAITYGIIAAPIVICAAVEVGIGAGIVSSYESYCTWYAGTSVSGYFTTGASGTLGLGTSAFTADVNSYFGASLLQSSGRTAFFNGASNATGQLYYKGTSNFNYAQPIFAGAIGNPFLSNFGESSISLTAENGFQTNGLFSKSFLSTFGSNHLGGKIGKQFETTLGYTPMQNVYDFTTKGAIETVENKIGDDMDTVIDALKK